jgi:hypothetical protein
VRKRPSVASPFHGQVFHKPGSPAYRPAGFFPFSGQLRHQRQFCSLKIMLGITCSLSPGPAEFEQTKQKTSMLRLSMACGCRSLIVGGFRALTTCLAPPGAKQSMRESGRRWRNHRRCKQRFEVGLDLTQLRTPTQRATRSPHPPWQHPCKISR